MSYRLKKRVVSTMGDGGSCPTAFRHHTVGLSCLFATRVECLFAPSRRIACWKLPTPWPCPAIWTASRPARIARRPAIFAPQPVCASRIRVTWPSALPSTSTVRPCVGWLPRAWHVTVRMWPMSASCARACAKAVHMNARAMRRSTARTAPRPANAALSCAGRCFPEPARYGCGAQDAV